MNHKTIITLMLCALFGFSCMAQEKKTFTVNGVSFNMVYVQGGTFKMGANDSKAYDKEKPVHRVSLSDYYIGETEVSQELWEAVMCTTIEQQLKKVEECLGVDSDLYGVGSNYPMYYISWEECQEFVAKLNQMTGENFSLPTEAEWEYAARGGNMSRGYKYSGSNAIDDVAWYWDNSSSSTHPVGTKLPNELGLHDMTGNVWEWCSDWYGDYSSSSQTNPTGPTTGSSCVLRGGSWGDYAQYCRVANRTYFSPGGNGFRFGFRLALRP